MQQWRGQVRPYSGFVLVTGILLLAGACSEATSPKNSSSTLGLTARTSLVASTGGPLLFVDVTARNESAVPIPYTSGCITNVEFALYRDAAHASAPFVEVPSTNLVCQALMAGSLAPSDSTTFEHSSLVSHLKQGTTSITAGTYYVTATLYYVGNAAMTVDAGTVAIP